MARMSPIAPDLQPVDRFDIFGLMVALQADADFQVLLFGVLVRSQHAANAGPVDAPPAFP